MRVLGIDPGSSATGFGLIERKAGVMQHLRHGVLRPPRGVALAERLNFLHRELLAIITREAPEIAVVERVFVATNPRSALVLGQARGAILASLGAAGVPVAELAASRLGPVDCRYRGENVGHRGGFGSGPQPGGAE